MINNIRERIRSPLSNLLYLKFKGGIYYGKQENELRDS